VLGRTRWRGVRFGLEKGAWGYAGRALWYWFLTIISAGILWPRMTFLLEKYRTDRTYFGSAKLVQGGRWPMLYRAAVPFVGAAAVTSLLAAWLLWLDPLLPYDPFAGDLAAKNVANFLQGKPVWFAWTKPDRVWLVPACLSALLYGAIHYRWSAKRIMANHKRAEGVSFASGIKAPRITMIYVLGMFISYMVLVLGIAVLVLLTLLLWGPSFGIGPLGAPTSALPDWLEFVLLGGVYLSVFLLWGVLHNTFVTFPLMRHMAVTTILPDVSGIPEISQRARDAFAEAEGFAEALDLGAAI